MDVLFIQPTHPRMDVKVSSVPLKIRVHACPSFQTLPGLFVLGSKVHLLLASVRTPLSVGCDDAYENILMHSANSEGNSSPK